MKLIREWLIGDSVWKVKFTSREFLDSADLDVWGVCCPGDKTIYLRSGMDEREKWKTLIHELLHAIEYETKSQAKEDKENKVRVEDRRREVRLPHLMVHRLEEPLLDLIEKNFLGRRL